MPPHTRPKMVCLPSSPDRQDRGEREGCKAGRGVQELLRRSRESGSRQRHGGSHSKYQGSGWSKDRRGSSQGVGAVVTKNCNVDGSREQGQAWVWSSESGTLDWQMSRYQLQLASDRQMAATLCMPAIPDRRHLHQWQPVPVHSAHPTWLPLVLGPAFAMDRMPAPVCLSSRVISSSNLPPCSRTAKKRSGHSAISNTDLRDLRGRRLLPP